MPPRRAPHYVFKDGQWATAPIDQVTISVDCAHAHGESSSARATNVTAIANTGAK